MLLILIILFVTIFFCHGLIRLCMFIVKGPPPDEGSGSSSSRRLRGAMLPEMLGPGGYAIPRQPIRVVLARDEEAVGIESEATKSNPPAYGLGGGWVFFPPPPPPPFFFFVPILSFCEADPPLSESRPESHLLDAQRGVGDGGDNPRGDGQQQ